LRPGGAPYTAAEAAANLTGAWKRGCRQAREAMRHGALRRPA